MFAKIENVKLLGIVAKPYEINGKKGISYKATVFQNKEVFTLKTTEEVFKDVGDKEDLECTLLVEYKESEYNGVKKNTLFLKEVKYS